MRVLFLCSEYTLPTQPLGGIFFRDQALALMSEGVQVDVVFVEPRSLRTISISALLRQRFQIVTAYEDGIFAMRRLGWNPGLPRAGSGRVYSALTFRLAERYLKRYGKPDLIHAHCALWVGPAAAKLKRTYDIPYVLTEHHSAILSLHGEKTERALCRSYAAADRLVAVSQHLADAVAMRVPDKAIDVVPNIVDTAFFSPVPRAVRTDGPRILAVGNLDRNKSHDVLLRAFAKARVSLPQATLTIAGGGPLLAELQSLAQSLNVHEAVTFSGQLPREGVRDLLRRSDMLVQPSKYETFGVTIIEAGAVGLPVIATACGGPNEIVTSANGVLVPVDDVEAIAGSIGEVWRRPWDPAAIRRGIVQKYGRRAIVQQLKSLYHVIVDTEAKRRHESVSGGRFGETPIRSGRRTI